jgi:hypothetical protein
MEALVHVLGYIINQVEAFRRRERKREPPAEILSGSEGSSFGLSNSGSFGSYVILAIFWFIAVQPSHIC